MFSYGGPPNFSHDAHPSRDAYIARIQDPEAPAAVIAGALFPGITGITPHWPTACRYAAGHPNLPTEAMRQYLSNPHNLTIEKMLLRRPDLPADLVQEYYASNKPAYDSALLDRDDCSAAWLTARVNNRNLRSLVAGHPNTPLSIKHQLAANRAAIVTHKAMLFRQKSHVRTVSDLDVETLRLLTKAQVLK